MIMSRDHQVGLTQRIAECAVDSGVGATFGGRQYRMVHHHHHGAVAGAVHRLAQPCQRTRQIHDMRQGVGINHDDAHPRDVEPVTGARHSYRSVIRMTERLAPCVRQGLMQPFRIFVVARTRDDGQTVQRAVRPLAQQQLTVILLSAVHPVADLHHEVCIRHTGSQKIVVRTRETAVDIAEHQNGINAVVRRIRCLEYVLQRVPCPSGFSGCDEPCLPAVGAYHCAHR